IKMKIIDPLAQSFYVEPDSGIFVTSVDLYFYSRDPELPVTVQLRPMQLGLPTSEVYPFSEVVVEPKNVNISNDASIPTRVTFDSPVYLAGKQFHALTILSNSSVYNVWISRLSEIEVSTSNLPEDEQILVSKQALSGSLFKSQNGSTWTPSQLEDLKFKLYRANFVDSGNINFYNPDLSVGNDQIATLVRDSLEVSSKKIKVGIGTTIAQSNLPTLGNTIIQRNSNATGNYVGSAGSAFSTLNIINAGIGYTPSSGTFVFPNVSLDNITGSGRDATANITISNGVAVAATIANGGTGYSVGDVLGITTIGSKNLGRNLRLSVSNISGINELIIDQVQGEYLTGVGNTLRYINNLGISTDLKATGANVTIPDGGIVEISDGLHIKVNHKNHGMNSNQNLVAISNVSSDLKPTKLFTDYASSSTDDISIESVSIANFDTFENVSVGATNPGYIRIEDEIISYTGVNSTSSPPKLTGITREIDQTKSFNYSAGSLVYKYELSGVSLRRINKTHDLSDSTVSSSLDLDFYNIKLDMSDQNFTMTDRSSSSGYPKLFLNETKSTGGSKINATQNIPFEIVKPIVQTMTLRGTNVNASVRTVSGSSIGGNEISFIDQGFEQINLNATNYLETPRIISSKVNESQKLSTLPANKSFTLNVNLSTTNAYVSPVIDLDRVGMIFTSNRVNNPISDYVNDDRVSTLKDDPSSFVYATKPISLETPASSIKVFMTAYVNTQNDIRGFYSITDDPNEELIYYPFPGYNNLTSTGEILSLSNSDGLPDKKVSKVDTVGFDSEILDFREYEFTIDNLPSFRYFGIKLVGTSTNQAYPPRIKDLRVIALA
ncbi:hypothetical protein EB169_03245, partial [archaeon]|nr:hypothetical protein [archaeon]NDB54827.1 hypothetical protein [archaeon]